MVRSELGQYGEGLSEKPEIVALTKADLVDKKHLSRTAKALETEAAGPVFAISAPIEEGLEPLLDAVIERLGTVIERAEADQESDWSPL